MPLGQRHRYQPNRFLFRPDCGEVDQRDSQIVFQHAQQAGLSDVTEVDQHLSQPVAGTFMNQQRLFQLFLIDFA